jgi:hypothetical protein
MAWAPKSYQRKRNQRHNTPRVGDAVFIDGHWSEKEDGQEIWIKAQWSRPNGHVWRVDRETEEATVRFGDHPFADPNEPRMVDISFSSFYGQWDTTRECFVLTDKDLS